MAIFNRNKVKPVKGPMIGAPDKMLDDMTSNMAARQIKSQSGAPVTAANQPQINKTDSSLSSASQAPAGDRVNQIRQGQSATQITPQTPTGPRVGKTPFNATTNQSPTIESDADRVARARQGIRDNDGKLPAFTGTPQAPTGPRRGSTPFNATTNQSDLTPDIKAPVPRDDRSQSEKILDEQIARLVAAGKGDEAQRLKARDAASKTFDEQNAFAIESARARSGAFGAGTLGAGQALEAQTAREGARAKTMTLEDLDRQAREEAIRSAMGVAEIVGQKENIDISRDKLGLDKDRFGFDKEMSQAELEIKKEAAAREAATYDMTIDEFELELGEDKDGDGLIAGKTEAEADAREKQKQIDAANDDPNNPLSDKNQMAFNAETGGNVQQVKAWADANGKPLTMEVVNQIKARYLAYKQRGGNSDFGTWMKAEADYYAGGWNPASNIRGII